MFCTNCGAQLPEGSTTCSKCNASLTGVSKTESGFLQGLLGFLILLLSWFTMPFKTLKVTAAQLKEVGGKGKLDVAHTEIPHLTWLGVAGRVVASIVVIVVIIGGIITGLTQGGIAIIAAPVGGFLLAMALDWLIMIFIEMISLLASIANDVKKVADKD
jgi:hypothetical protein